MSLGDDIIRALTTYSSGANYRLLENYLSGYYADNKSQGRRAVHIPHESIRTAIRRLKKKGFIKKRENSFFLTVRGGEYFRERKEKQLPQHQESVKQQQKDNGKIIIAFDVPEIQRHKRDWLRIELAVMNFRPIQKSVWIGPAPLTKKFIINLGQLGVLEFVKFFRVTERDIA